MSSVVKEIKSKGLVNPPNYVHACLQYEVVIGSNAYGVSENYSDLDIYGFCVPPKDMVFPHLAGEIQGFGRQKKRFDQWQQHHIVDGDHSYDIQIFNIVKFFQLCMETNPNMLDSLFVPNRCVLYATRVGQLVRENRKQFLCKKAWHTFKGYAYSSLHKAKIKNPQGLKEVVDFEQQNHIVGGYTVEQVEAEILVYNELGPSHSRAALSSLSLDKINQYLELLKKCGIRATDVLMHGFDTKYCYHIVRLMDQVEQILTLGDMDLERDRERLKAIRRGEVSFEDIEKLFSEKEKSLEAVYLSSTLRNTPDEEGLKMLLLQCLEEHFGSISNAIAVPDGVVRMGEEIQAVLERYGIV